MCIVDWFAGRKCKDQLAQLVPKFKQVNICVEKKNQLDVTECFIACMIRSTCFGYLYAHHQELETICVQEEGRCTTSRAASLLLDSQPAALDLTRDKQPSTAHHRR